MPEGHTIHRLAREVADRFAGHPLDVSSPQGKFADGAALLVGGAASGSHAHGQHRLLGVGPGGGGRIQL
ncbi:Fpg/Nei family DNA glycosylase, partial [Streptomyces sp. NPDC006992]